jgi:hypothetical protein
MSTATMVCSDGGFKVRILDGATVALCRKRELHRKSRRTSKSSAVRASLLRVRTLNPPSEQTMVDMVQRPPEADFLIAVGIELLDGVTSIDSSRWAA